MSTKEDIRTSDDAEDYIRDLTASIEKRSKILKAFCAKESWTRADVSRLKSVTEAYETLMDLEAQIVAAHNDWMEFVEAENKNILDAENRQRQHKIPRRSLGDQKSIFQKMRSCKGV